MAIISARRIFCDPGSLFAIFRFLNGLYIPYPVFFMSLLSIVCLFWWFE